MPFTPYHFGPCACIGLPLNKYIDIPTFILSNVVVDLEPLAVMLFSFNYPLHGYCHTFLIGTALGIIAGLLVYLSRNFWGWWMRFFRLPYPISLMKMFISGVLGIWFHVFLDGFFYKEMNPFWPIAGNPLFATVTFSRVFTFCEIGLIVAATVYPARAYSLYKKQKNR